MPRFTFRAFVRDRRVYILVYAAFGLLTAAVVQLDLWLHDASLHYTNLVYIVILGFVGLLLFLAYDYRRQAAFLSKLDQMFDAGDLDRLSTLPGPVTLEQELFADAWARMYSLLNTAFSEERHRTRRRLHFLSRWAHHMKTPVAVIDLELQKARQNPDYPRELVDSLAEENERLGRSLQALLHAIRLDDFAADFKIEAVYLPDLVRKVVNDYRHAFIAHRVFPRVEAPEEDAVSRELLTVRSDAKWLRLVVEQLISNAIKYSAGEGREGRVTVSFRQEEGKTVLTVSDNGIGIPPEDLGRIFDPFFTGSAGRKHATSTGLGLYLAREACDRLGHTITVRSAPGAGTQVDIVFPRDTSIFAGMPSSVTAK